MLILENIMALRNLAQHSITVVPYLGAEITCSKVFGQRTVRIEAFAGGGKKEYYALECFANTTCALAYVTGVVGIEPLTANCKPDIVCGTCTTVDGYPVDYYCTQGILYDTIVCGCKDAKYYVFNDVRSTDFTPRCPGDQVLVALNRTIDTPTAQLSRANANPRKKQSFAGPLSPDGSFISILPFEVDMPRRERVQQ